MFQTDFSIARAEKFDRKRARADVKARRYERKADRAGRSADRWLERNERLKRKPVSSIKVSDKSKKYVDDHVKKLSKN